MKEFYITCIKTLFMFICITFTMIKAGNYKLMNNKKRGLIFVVSLLITVFYGMVFELMKNKLTILLSNLIIYFFYGFILSEILEEKLKCKMILIIISMALCYISIFIATFINFFILQIPYINITENSILEYIAIGTIQFILLYVFFKIKRFKNGFSFFKNDNSMQKLNYIGIILSCLIIFIYIMFCLLKDNFIGTLIFGGILLGTCLMIYWIRKSITNYYKKQMKQRTMELHAKQINEKDKIIKDLKEELENTLKINHKYNHRLSAMEKAVEKLGEKLKYNEEFGTEYADILNSIKDLSKEYRHELYETTNIKKLPKTNIFSIDNLLEYMKTEAEKQNIEFNLEIHNDINNMVENIISKSKLETLIGDHIKDAIIAINCSNNKNRKILLTFNMNNEIYEIKFKDTGIEFEINTLLKLGLEKTTTHKETGGSGIGFMTTFETMNECKASLIIEEQPISNNNYTKTITIKFDGKNEYKIISYRAGEIKKETNNNRIIIEKI